MSRVLAYCDHVKSCFILLHSQQFSASFCLCEDGEELLLM